MKITSTLILPLVALASGLIGNLPLHAQPDRGADPKAPAVHLPAPGSTEVFATADDGTALHWRVFAPAGSGRRPVVLVIHGGGFISAREQSPNTTLAAQELAAAGFMVFSIEYRLAPPGHLAGQKSSGRFPDQTNDVHRAVHAARVDPRGNGQVGGLGGSAGGYHVAFAALTGTPGDDRLDVGVCLSGAYDLSDVASQATRGQFKSKVINYAGSSDRAKLLAASPVSFVSGTMPPLFLIQSAKEAMPPQQLPDLAAKILAIPATAWQQQQLTLPGGRHSFAYWPDVKAQAIAFLQAAFVRRPARSSAVGEARAGGSL